MKRGASNVISFIPFFFPHARAYNALVSLTPTCIMHTKPDKNRRINELVHTTSSTKMPAHVLSHYNSVDRHWDIYSGGTHIFV